MVPTSLTLSLAAMSLAAMGVWGTLGPFWALPTAFLTGRAAAGGVALVNSVANIGGFVGPTLMGYMRDTHRHVRRAVGPHRALVIGR